MIENFAKGPACPLSYQQAISNQALGLQGRAGASATGDGDLGVYLCHVLVSSWRELRNPTHRTGQSLKRTVDLCLWKSLSGTEGGPEPSFAGPKQSCRLWSQNSMQLTALSGNHTHNPGFKNDECGETCGWARSSLQNLWPDRVWVAFSKFYLSFVLFCSGFCVYFVWIIPSRPWLNCLLWELSSDT